MILENPYHRRKVKAILQENKRLKAEVERLLTLPNHEPVEFQDGEISFLKKQVKELKQKIQGYKMQNAKLRKQFKELNNDSTRANADSGS